jgi:FkbM family methyltransferase
MVGSMGRRDRAVAAFDRYAPTTSVRARARFGGSREPELAVLPHVVRAGDTVVDVGAHRGLYTSALSRLVGASGMVHAFEPLLPEAGYLERAFRSRPNVRIHRTALSDHSGTATLVIPERNGRQLNGHATLDTHQVGAEVRVASTRLDDLELSPSYVKIDVEGQEAAVLAGGAQTVARSRPVVQVEILRPATGHRRPLLQQLLAQFEDLGYSACVVGKNGELVVFEPTRLWWPDDPIADEHYAYNFVFVPSERAASINAMNDSLVGRLGRIARRAPASRTKSRAGRVVSTLLAKVGCDPVQVGELTGGTRLWLDARERTEAGPFWNGRYEDNDVAMLQASLRPGGDYVDVGAHVGLLALRLARAQLVNGGRVIAIEPLPHNIARFRRSLTLDTRLERVTVLVECAVGADEGRATIVGERAHDTGNAAIAPRGSASDEGVSVPLRTLDSVLADEAAGRVDVIKLDVEGFELQVLRGVRGHIVRDRPVIFGEYAPHLMRCHGAMFAHVVEFFRDLDYRYFTQTEDARFVELSEPGDSVAYVIAVPSERATDWIEQVAARGCLGTVSPTTSSIRS